MYCSPQNQSGKESGKPEFQKKKDRRKAGQHKVKVATLGQPYG